MHVSPTQSSWNGATLNHHCYARQKTPTSSALLSLDSFKGTSTQKLRFHAKTSKSVSVNGPFSQQNPIHSHTCCISLSHITPHFGVKSRLLSAPLSAQIPVAQHAHELATGQIHPEQSPEALVSWSLMARYSDYSDFRILWEDEPPSTSMSMIYNIHVYIYIRILYICTYIYIYVIPLAWWVPTPSWSFHK